MLMEEERVCSLIIVDLNNNEIPLKTVTYEMVFELREYLGEHINTCFFTNFYFEHNSERLGEYQELSELPLQTNNRIFMRPDMYCEKSARIHIQKFQDLLEKPQMLTASSNQEQQVRSRSASFDQS